MEELGLVGVEAGEEVLAEVGADVGLLGVETGVKVCAEVGLVLGTVCLTVILLEHSVIQAMDMGCHGLAVATHGKR